MTILKNLSHYKVFTTFLKRSDHGSGPMVVNHDDREIQLTRGSDEIRNGCADVRGCLMLAIDCSLLDVAPLSWMDLHNASEAEG